jgi:hypothetical protein
VRDNALAILVGFSEMVPTSAQSQRQRLPIWSPCLVERSLGWGDATEDEVLGNKLVELANGLDLSRFAFCRDFGNVHGGCGVDSAREDLGGTWRDLMLF